jgi:hypothetical protein
VGDKEDLLLMIQMNGQKGVVKFNQVDISLMNVLAKIAGSAILKLKAERLASDQLQRTYNLFETCKLRLNLIFLVRGLLSERNHAVLNQIIKQNLGRLFKFKHVGIMFAEHTKG